MSSSNGGEEALTGRIKAFGFLERSLEKALAGISVQPTYARPGLRRLSRVYVLPGVPALFDRFGQAICMSKRSLIPHDIGLPPRLVEVLERKQARKIPATIEVPRSFETIEDEVIYGGVAMQHYGHFLV